MTYLSVSQIFLVFVSEPAVNLQPAFTLSSSLSSTSAFSWLIACYNTLLSSRVRQQASERCWEGRRSQSFPYVHVLQFDWTSAQCRVRTIRTLFFPTGSVRRPMPFSTRWNRGSCLIGRTAMQGVGPRCTPHIQKRFSSQSIRLHLNALRWSLKNCDGALLPDLCLLSTRQALAIPNPNWKGR